MSIQMKLSNDAKVVIAGDFESISKASKVLASAKISGVDIADRLVIQKIIDDYCLTATISYNGCPVFSVRRIQDNLKKLKESGNLSNMSDETYYILSNMFDYPHVSKNIYIKFYNNNYINLLKGITITYHPGKPDVNIIADILSAEKEKLFNS